MGLISYLPDDITLREALDQYQQHPGSPQNSYAWWCKSAQRRGEIGFGASRQFVDGGSTMVPVFKRSNRWFVDPVRFKAAMAECVAVGEEQRAITAAYDRHELLGAPGETVTTTWGHYYAKGPFHLRHSSRTPSWKGSGNTWVCSTCWSPAPLEHERDECHKCSDWGSCGRDCTLSAAVCSKCGSRIGL